MANYRKSFNFRNGVQVDNDNFIVNANGLVGIGTSIPTEFLDVYGDNSGAVKVRGLTTTTTLGVGETAIFYGQIRVGSAITIDPSSGIISATKFIGDASGLQGVFAISTTGWVAQGVGLHTFRSIGIGTTNPEYSLQVGQNPLTSSGVAIESSGNIRISGVITASNFSGTATTADNLSNAANITTGTINNSRLSSVLASNISVLSGISTFNQISVGSGITAAGDTVTATNFVGTATTANNLSDAANITAGKINSARLPDVITSNINSSSGISTFSEISVGSGITAAGDTVTATNFVGTATSSIQLKNARNFSVSGDVTTSSASSFDGTSDVNLSVSLSNSFSANTVGVITANTLSSNIANLDNLNSGIGTFENVRLNSATSSSVVITGDTNASVSIGKSVGAGNSSAQLLYTPGAGRLDINNYDVGGVSVNLHQGTGTGTTEGFVVRYDNTKQFEVTYDGRVAVNRGSTPITRNFEVGGDIFVSNDAKVAGILTVGSGSFQVTLGDGSDIPVPTTQNFNTITGISTFFRMNVTNEFTVGSSSTIGQNLYVGNEVGIGTTNSLGFVTGLSPLSAQVFGNLYTTQGLVSGGRIGITTNTDGSFQEDTRPIPTSLGSVVPYMSYGNFQVDTGSSSFITENLLIVPKVGVHVVGFGSTNLGLVPSNYNGNKYLTKVGVNTYFARSIFDVGTASTTMNSYFIPPSLTQGELDIVSNLWDPGTSSALTGHEQSFKVTPEGVIPGSIVYNKTTEEIQVGIKSDTFAPIIPIGGIIMWSGSIASIPNGWRLCDGTNGTPDLRDRFIVGAGGAYSVNVTGGRTDAVLPRHGHSISDPGHAHTYDGQTTEVIVEGTSGVEIVDSNVGVTSTTSNVTTGITTTAQVGVALTGGENLPPFWALAYIMRTNA